MHRVRSGPRRPGHLFAFGPRHDDTTRTLQLSNAFPAEGVHSLHRRYTPEEDCHAKPGVNLYAVAGGQNFDHDSC